MSTFEDTASGAVSGRDPHDYYGFELNDSAQVSVLLTGLSAEASVRLLDRAGREVAATEPWPAQGNGAERLELDELGPGGYYLDVQYDGWWYGETSYGLDVMAKEPAPEPFWVQPPARLDAEPVAYTPGEAVPPDIEATPHTAIGQLSSTLTGPWGYPVAETLSTAFLISPEHVVTSAHGLTGEGQSFGAGTFYPGLNGERSDAASYAVEEAHLQREAGFPGDGILPPLSDWPDDDIAVLELAEPVEAPSIRPFQALRGGDAPDGLDPSGQAVSWAGYPVDGVAQDNPNTAGPDYLQWEAAGSVAGLQDEGGTLTLDGGMQGTAGASGAPVWTEHGGQRQLLGVFAGAEDGQPVAAALDEDTLSWMLDIVQADGYFTESEVA